MTKITLKTEITTDVDDLVLYAPSVNQAAKRWNKRVEDMKI